MKLQYHQRTLETCRNSVAPVLKWSNSFRHILTAEWDQTFQQLLELCHRQPVPQAKGPELVLPLCTTERPLGPARRADPQRHCRNQALSRRSPDYGTIRLQGYKSSEIWLFRIPTLSFNILVVLLKQCLLIKEITFSGYCKKYLYS